MRPFWGWLSLVVGLLCLLTLADIVQPFFLKLLIDDVFPRAGGQGGNWSLLWVILPGIGLIYLSRNTLFYSSRMLSLKIGEDLCFDLRKRLFDHLQQLSMSFYKANQPGRISSRLMDDTFKIQSFIQDKLPTFMRYVLEFGVLLALIYVVNWRLALASTVVLPLHFWTYRRFRRPIRESHSEAQENLAAAHGNIVEKFLGMEVVKGFSAEDRESKTFRAAIDASRKSSMRSQRFHFAQKVAADLLVGLGTVLLLGYGAWEVRGGRMTGGAFFMFFWYVKMLYPAVLEVISGAGHLTKAAGSVDRVFEMLDEPVREETTRGESVVELTELEGRIEYVNASFSYGPDGPLVLEGINLAIEPGEHVAITGPSGAGKSTLISLLPRFNDATGGQVRIDGRPAETISIRALRGLFGIVFQEVFLFNTSIYENLRYAQPDATPVEVIEACRITGADDFIQRLPQGYFTRIGAAGGELSRGEKQRITLARALVRNPRVLVIDEATASIDQPAAREIIDSILTLMEGRTVIMVTHDAELLRLVDRVICIEDGRLVYDGASSKFDLADVACSYRNGSPGRSPRPLTDAESVAQETRAAADGAAMVEPKGAVAPRPRRLSRSTPGGAATAILLALLLLGGCAGSSQTSSSLAIEEPRISGGLFLDEPDPDRLRQLAEALDALPLEPEGIRPDAAEAVASVGPAHEAGESSAEGLASPPVIALSEQGPEKPTIGEAADMIALAQLPSNAVRLLTLPKLTDTEIIELVDNLVLRLSAEKGYAPASSVLADSLPPPPEGVRPLCLIARAEGEAMHAIRFGYRRYLSQPPQLWMLAVTAGADDALTVNADGSLIEPALNETIAAVEALRSALSVGDLESKLIQLSYVDAPTAMSMLTGMGVTCLSQPGEVPQAVEFGRLPYVISVPDPAANEVGLVGEGTMKTGEFGLSLTPSLASQLSPNTVASPMTQLLVMFHPAHPEQFSRVRTYLDDYIDRPARQIFVEGMVLEISEDGLKDLGIEWEFSEGPLTLRAGSPSAEGLIDTLNLITTDLGFHNIPTPDFETKWTVTIRALIRDGKAEVLARPSVLTLNNRQSTIRVGQDIPIATSQEGLYGSANKIAFNFKYLPTGILLNIRPRINEEGSEVSMLIDTIVSSVVPGEDLEIRSTEGELLATAPTVSTRRVQTYSRIRNNTPFIIGGLVLRENTTQLDKIPLLGDIPLIGMAFRAERSISSKTEVIIVLTPYVLPEDHHIARSLPKDEDFFDSFGNELFRDSYRIRTEDVFDLSFLFENKRLQTYRQLAREALQKNFRLAEEEPFKSFTGERIPGEDILVTRMIYEVVKRLDTADEINIRRVIFFEGQQVGGYDVRFIERTLAQLGGGMVPSAFFRNLPGKALAVTYCYDRQSMDPDRLASEPIPELSVVDCPDRAAWGALLWELNQPAPDGRDRYTILLHDESDLERLRRALALKRIVNLNGGAEQLMLRNFSVGKVLLMPELKPDQVHVIDADVARYFFHTEHYYAATVHEIEQRLTELDEKLRRPAVRLLLEAEERPAEGTGSGGQGGPAATGAGAGEPPSAAETPAAGG